MNWVVVVGADLLGTQLALAFHEHNLKVACVHDAGAPPPDGHFDAHFLPSDLDGLAQLKPIGVTPALEHDVVFAEQLAHRLGVPGQIDDGGTGRRDKAEMMRVAQANGVRVPKTVTVDNADAVEETRLDWDVSHVVVKPRMAYASLGASLVSNRDDAERAVQAALDAPNGHRGFIVQEYIDGPEFYVNAVSCHGHHRVVEVWRAAKRRVGTRPFAYDYFHLLPWEGDRQEALRAFALQALTAVGVRNGPSHTEIRWDANGPVLIEVGARSDGMAQIEISRRCLGTSVPDLLALSLTAPDDFIAAKDVPLPPLEWSSRVDLHPPSGGLWLRARFDRVHALRSFAAEHPYGRVGDVISDPELSSIGSITLVHADREVLREDHDELRRLEGHGLLFDVVPVDPDALSHALADARDPRSLPEWASKTHARIVEGRVLTKRDGHWLVVAWPNDSIEDLRQLADNLDAPLVVQPAPMGQLDDTPLDAVSVLRMHGLEPLDLDRREAWVCQPTHLPWLDDPPGTFTVTDTVDGQRFVLCDADLRAVMTLVTVDRVVWLMGWEGAMPSEAHAPTVVAALRSLDADAIVLGPTHSAIDALADATGALPVQWPAPLEVTPLTDWYAASVGSAHPQVPATSLERYRRRRGLYQTHVHAGMVQHMGSQTVDVGCALGVVYGAYGRYILSLSHCAHLDMPALAEALKREDLDGVWIHPWLSLQVRAPGVVNRIDFGPEDPLAHQQALAKWGFSPTPVMPLPTSTSIIDLADGLDAWLRRMNGNTRREIVRAHRDVSFTIVAFADLTVDLAIELRDLIKVWEGSRQLPMDWVFLRATLAAVGDDGGIVLAHWHGELVGAGTFVCVDRTVHWLQSWWHPSADDCPAVSSALLYECAAHAAAKGCDVLDLQGIHDPRFPNKNPDWLGFSTWKARIGALPILLPPSYVASTNAVLSSIG